MKKISIYDLDMPQYKFMGWTDDTGNVITTIEPGTKNITLHANWISYKINLL